MLKKTLRSLWPIMVGASFLILLASPVSPALNEITSLTLQNNVVSALIVNSGQLYAGIGTPTVLPTVSQIDLTGPFTLLQSRTCDTSVVLAMLGFPTPEPGPVASMIVGGNRLFVGLGGFDTICSFALGGSFANTVTIRKLSLSTPFSTNPAVSQCASVSCTVRALAVSGDDIYVGLDIAGAPFRGAVARIGLSSFPAPSTRDAVCSTFADGAVYGLEILEGFLYVAVREVPPASASHVVRIDTSTCLVTGPPLVLSALDGETQISSLTTIASFLFAGLATTPGKLVKIDTADFRKISTLTLDAGEDSVTALTTEPIVSNIVLAGLGTTPGCVVKIDPFPNPPKKTATLCFNPSEDKVRALETAGAFIFAGLETLPGMIVKIQDPPESTTTTIANTVSETQSSTSPSSISLQTVTVTLATSQGFTTTQVATTIVNGETKTLTRVIVIVGKENTGGPVAVPGFPAESIIIGLFAGFLALSYLKRRDMDSKDCPTRAF